MKEPFPVWLLSTSISNLHAGEVHIWSVDLNKAEAAFDHLRETLTEDEVERASRFQFEYLVRRFII